MFSPDGLDTKIGASFNNCSIGERKNTREIQCRGLMVESCTLNSSRNYEETKRKISKTTKRILRPLTSHIIGAIYHSIT